MQTADDELFGSAVKLQRNAAALFALGRGDRIGAHHGAAVDLPEATRIEARQELAQRRADQVLARLGDDANVLVGGLEVDDVVDVHHVDGVADADLQHAQRLGRRGGGRCAAGRAEQSAQPLDDGAELLGRRDIGTRRERRLQALDGRLEPRCLHGLEKVVDRRALERLQRVLVVGGDEDEQRKGAVVVGPVLCQRLRRLEAAHAGHADVEEDDVRPVRQGLLDGGFAVAGDGGNLERRPQGGELGAQTLGEQRLVFGNDGAGFHDRGSLPALPALSSGRRIVASVPPSASAAGARVNEARAP